MVTDFYNKRLASQHIKIQENVFIKFSIFHFILSEDRFAKPSFFHFLKNLAFDFWLAKAARVSEAQTDGSAQHFVMRRSGNGVLGMGTCEDIYLI